MLDAVGRGEPQAPEELLAHVHQELRRLAAHKMSGEAAGHTLRPTAMVHEAWLRRLGGKEPQFANRAHFVTAAGEAMRRILVESARQAPPQTPRGSLRP